LERICGLPACYRYSQKDVYEARGATSAQPLKLYVDYNTKALHDVSDVSRIYAKLDENGGLEVTVLGKAC
jgi:hypothetical protein